MDESAITCDEINDEKTKTVTANFNEKNAICILYIKKYIKYYILYMIYNIIKNYIFYLPFY